MVKTISAQLVGMGDEVSFVQVGRTERRWNNKIHKLERKPDIQPRHFKGVVTAVSVGARSVQIAVRTRSGNGTAHLPLLFAVQVAS